jgi:hypothetical protein
MRIEVADAPPIDLRVAREGEAAVDRRAVADVVRDAIRRARDLGLPPVWTSPPAAGHRAEYRASDIPEALAWSVLEHPLSDAGDRVAAARELAASGALADAAGRTRVTAVAQASAYPELVAVLDEVLREQVRDGAPRATPPRVPVRVRVADPTTAEAEAALGLAEEDIESHRAARARDSE